MHPRISHVPLERQTPSRSGRKGDPTVGVRTVKNGTVALLSTLHYMGLGRLSIGSPKDSLTC
jgi:hypothetical protein